MKVERKGDSIEVAQGECEGFEEYITTLIIRNDKEWTCIDLDKKSLGKTIKMLKKEYKRLKRL